MDPVQTGAWIAARRKALNLTQKELADRLGVTDKAVSRWETGKGYPDIGLLPALAEALNCSVNELLSGKRLSPQEAPAAAEENLTALCRSAGQSAREQSGFFQETRVEYRPERIVLRRSLWTVLAAVLALWLALLGVNMVLVALPEWSDWSWSLTQTLELLMLSVWFLLTLSFGFYWIFVRPGRLVLDREGVELRGLLWKKRLGWEQLRDYGVSYLLHDRGELLYVLYFSETELEFDDTGRKKLSRGVLQIRLSAQLLDAHIGPIMDFCQDHSELLPFLVYPYDRLRFQQRGG